MTPVSLSCKKHAHSPCLHVREPCPKQMALTQIVYFHLFIAWCVIQFGLVIAIFHKVEPRMCDLRLAYWRRQGLYVSMKLLDPESEHYTFWLDIVYPDQEWLLQCFSCCSGAIGNWTRNISNISSAGELYPLLGTYYFCYWDPFCIRGKILQDFRKKEKRDSECSSVLPSIGNATTFFSHKSLSFGDLDRG